MSRPMITEASATPLNLPVEYEDLEGILQIDLQAIASMLTQRAHERLLLTRREYHELYNELLEGMAGAINERLEPLTVECR
jgi:hypothetical protein